MFTTLSDFGGSIFEDLRRIQREMDDLFGFGQQLSTGIRSPQPGAFPPVNIGSTDESVDVYLFAPGLDPKSMDISIQQNLLTISGKREGVKEVENTNFYRRERFSGTFKRVITLPDDVDPENVDATYKEGVLHVQVQRKESSKPRLIQVK